MSDNIIPNSTPPGQEVTPVSVDQLRDRAARWIAARMGLAGAGPDEFIAGYIDNFLPVYVDPNRQDEGEYWYVWILTPGGVAARIVTETLPGLYLDHEGHVYQVEPDHLLVLGTIARIGDSPLLTRHLLDEWRHRREGDDV